MNKDVLYAISLPRVILRTIGLWPLSKTSSIYSKIGQRAINLTCIFLHIFVLVPGFLHMFLRESQLHMRLKVFGPLCSGSLSLLKYLFLLPKSMDIAKGLADIEKDWKDAETDDNRRIMLSKGKVAKKIAFTLAILVYSSGIPFRTIFPLSKGRILLPNNTTVRAFACASYLVIINEQVTPIYEIVFFLQLLSGLVVYALLCAPCGFAAFFVLHVCGQLRILINQINGITSGDYLEEKIIRERIGVVVQQHMKARK